MSRSVQRQGESIWNSTEKINSELLALTYGSLVVQLLQDMDNIQEVNSQLDKMGYNIGLRLVDDLLSKSEVNCSSIKDTAEVIAKVGFKMYLGVACEITNWSTDEKEFSIVLYENPLLEFVELPEGYEDLVYLNLLCGVIRGALEMVRYQAKCYVILDSLKGNDSTEIRVEVLGMIQDEYIPDED